MALYNEILVGRHNRFLQKLFQLKGGPPSPQLTSEITPSIALTNGAENRYLESWNRFGITQFVAAVPAQRNAVRLRNPPTSNVIAVIEKLSVFSITGADQPTLTVHDADPGNLTTVPTLTQNSLDNRMGGTNGPALQQSNSNNAGAIAGSQIWEGAFAINVTVDVIVNENQELPVLPGMAYTMWCNIVNSSIGVSFFWRERFLEDSERA